MAFLPTGELAYCVSTRDKQDLVLYDPAADREKARLPLGGWVVAFSPDGSRVALACGTELCVRTVPHLREECLVKGPHDWGATYRFSHGGRYLVVHGHDEGAPTRGLRIYSTTTGKEVARLASEDLGDVRDFSFCADGETVAVEHHRDVAREPAGGSEKVTARVALRLWGLADGRERGRLGRDIEWCDDSSERHHRYGERLAWCGASPDGWRLRETPDGERHASPPFVGDRHLLFDIQLAGWGAGAATFRFNRGWRPEEDHWCVSVRHGELGGAGDVWSRMQRARSGSEALPVPPDGRWLACKGGRFPGSKGDHLLVWNLPTLRSSAAAPDEERLQQLWQALVDGRQDHARRAAALLAAFPERSLPWLAGKVRAAPARDARWIERSIAELDDEEFAVRREAQTRLEAWGIDAGPALKVALKDPPSPEVRRRAGRALAAIYQGEDIPPEARRTVWVLEILEQLGTPAARATLRDIASGEGSSWGTREAARALRRLEKQ